MNELEIVQALFKKKLLEFQENPSKMKEAYLDALYEKMLTLTRKDGDGK